MPSAHDRASKPDHFGREKLIAVTVFFASAGIGGNSPPAFSAKQFPIGRDIEPTAGVIASNNLAVSSAKLRLASPDVARIPNFIGARVNSVVRGREFSCRAIGGNFISLSFFIRQLLFRTRFVVRIPTAAPHL